MAARKPARRSRPSRSPRKATRRPTRSAKPRRTAKRRTAAKARKRLAASASRQTASKRRPKKIAKRAKPVGKAPARPAPKKAAAPPAPQPPRPARPAPKPAARPAFERERRRLVDVEDVPAKPSFTEAELRARSAARSGHDELRSELERHTETSPVLTAGDVDAKWEDAYAIGDEAPGGDNPTPDQDRVDDIGKALGVTYEDAEELRASDKIAERDLHRWELDPASADDWPHDPRK